jgi:uncharacterized Zn finger protein
MPRRTWNDQWNRYPESVPLPAGDGLATSKQRGAMADTWWSKRFVEVLESFGLGTRMGRGRRYARAGQVISFDVRAGLLVAQVQGSRPKPYVVTITAATPSASQWRAIDDALRSRIGFAAQLLAGEVPSELEGVFSAANAFLFPSTWGELDAGCNCPDWENPCKHIAAVLYLFADHLDADPWLLLQWRGRTRDQILDPLRVPAADDERSEQPEIAAWWPFTKYESPSGEGGSEVFARELGSDPAEPPEAVLRRCEALGVTVRDREVSSMLVVAYEVLARREY